MATIMIVDDSELILKVLGHQLAKAGHQVQTQSRPNHALMAALRSQPDVVLLDVNIPDLDGPKFCRSVSGPTRILLHSSQSDEALQQTAQEWGAHGYIGKRWTPEQKLAALASGVA